MVPQIKLTFQQYAQEQSETKELVIEGEQVQTMFDGKGITEEHLSEIWGQVNENDTSYLNEA